MATSPQSQQAGELALPKRLDVKDTDSSTSTLVADTPSSGSPEPPILSTFRKCLLLVIFLSAQFLDAFNISALYSAIPTMAQDLNMTGGQSLWIVSATQLTFAAFLLVSGRISDVYNPKYAFITGIFGLGAINLGIGFANNKIVLFVLRAISGIFTSLTIPSGLNLIVKLFPEPLEQSRAIGMFGAMGGIGNILGLLIGAVFVQYASWPWIFWFTTFITVLIAFSSAVLIPEQKLKKDIKAKQMKGLDIIGVSLLTTALILFIFSLTTGSSAGWATAEVIAPMAISGLLLAGFLYWETTLPEFKAAVPPRTWFYPNFSILIGTALLPLFWWITIFLVFINLWQDVYHYSPIISAIHMFPIGVSQVPITFTGPLSRFISSKWFIFTGDVMMAISSLLLPFAGREDRYWSLVFPAFFIGSAGAMLTYTHTNIAIFRSTPPRMAGTVGAMLNSATQLGSVVGSAVVTSIQTSIAAKPGQGGANGYQGRADAFWFLFATTIIEAIAVLVFYRPHKTERLEESDTNDANIEDVKTTANKGEV